MRSGGHPEYDVATDRPARRATSAAVQRSLDVRVRAPLADPKAVLGALPEVEGWEQTPYGYTLNVSDPDLAAPALARALVAADADILSIAESRHSLEDVYLELIDEDVEAKRP